MSAKRKKPQLFKCGKIEYILGKLNKKYIVSVFTSHRVFQKSFSNNFARETWIFENIPQDDDIEIIELSELEQEKYSDRLEKINGMF